jgi:Fur family ferric uptake transcriptional regulator
MSDKATVERQTRQKLAVLGAIERSGRSLSPAEIWSAAQREVPTLNLSTVYRQLKALNDEALVLKVELPGQPPRFEAPCAHASLVDDHDHHHHHFHCTGCDRVFPIHGCPGAMDALAPAGFRVERHDLTLHGLCSHCNAATAS